MYQCHGACAEVDSDTEAVAGRGFKLGCISCKRRSEVEGSAAIEWYFRAKGESDFVRVSAKPQIKRIFSLMTAQDVTGAAQTQSTGRFPASKGVLVVRASLKSNLTYRLHSSRQKLFINHNLSPSLSHTYVLDYMIAPSAEVIVRFTCNRL